jgi:DNA-binding IclR family transcriptional regulator
MSKNQYVISSVEKSFNVLMEVAKNGKLSIRELSKITKINKSTLFRIIKTLEELDFLHMTNDDGYILGKKVHELMKYTFSNNDIKIKMHPHLMKIWDETGETVQLAVIDNNELLIIDIIEGIGEIRVFSDIGTRLPLDYGNLGKVYLSTNEENSDELYIDIRNKGYSYSVDDPIELAFGLAAPIFSKTTNDLVAIIAISGPNSKKNQNNMKDYKKTLLEEVDKISKMF